MGKIGEEITQKIKSAVKAKLIELGIEVDNELPDYIMVLVANKKNQDQMENDLQLFLGTNTSVFTSWLLNVLKKLEEVTVSNKNVKRIDVTEQVGSNSVLLNPTIVNIKNEEDANRKSEDKVQVKVEPGTQAPPPLINVEENEETTEDVEDGASENNPPEQSSSDEDEGSESQSGNEEENLNSNQEAPIQSSENVQNDSDSEESNHEKLSPYDNLDKAHEDVNSDNLTQNMEDQDSYEQLSETVDQRSQSPPEAESVNDSLRPKVVYSEIREQIEEVMEKTLKDNKRPRSREDVSSRSERSRLSPDEHRRSSYDQNRIIDSRMRSDEGYSRSRDDRSRSPDYRRRMRSDRRRSPDDHKRLYSDRRKSPDDRRSFVDRRRSPVKSRSRLQDAREILKRRSNRRSQDLSPTEHSGKEESHRNEKRRKVVSSLVHKPESREEKAPSPVIPSLVRVTPRPLRRDSIQPNKKLLLLAVADAEKSVSRQSSSTSSSRKRELPKLESEEIEDKSPKAAYVPPEKIFVTLTNQKYTNDEKGYVSSSREVSTRKLYEDNELTLEDELLYEETYFDYEKEESDEDGVICDEKSDYLTSNEKSLQAKSKRLSERKCIISLGSSPEERSGDEWENMSEMKGGVIRAATVAETSQGKMEDLEKQEEGFEWNRLGPAPIATVKPLAQGGSEKFKCEAMNKALERCKFWPNCISPETCIFYHPSTACKIFPLCKAGKECLFIHPDCKFGSACLNAKCNFLHKSTTVKAKVLEIAPIPAVSGKTSPKIKCTYFPNCKNLNCKFWHPVKNCKYGRSCARSDCYFFHPTLVIPPKELLTWTSKN